jgi:hypothetical protein
LKKHPVRDGIRNQLRGYGAVNAAGERLLAARRFDDGVVMSGTVCARRLLRWRASREN